MSKFSAIVTTLLCLGLTGAILMAAADASGKTSADDPASESTKQATGGPRMLPVVTLRTKGDDGSPSYWWRTPSEPEWTAFDRALRAQLREAGVPTVDFDNPPRISRIYQRPDLSLQNAAALCSLLDVRRLLHGTVTVDRSEQGPAHGTGFATATATLKLVDTGARAPTVLQDFSVERSASRSTAQKAVEEAQKLAARAAASMISRISQRSGGRMSIDRAEPLIGLWGARKANSLQTIEELMLKADGVEDVSLRWAAEGVVGFEVNPGKKDPVKTIEYVARVVLNESLESVTVRKREKQIDGMVSLELTETDGSTNGSKTP